MVRISATNGMYRMQEEAANRKRTETESSRDVAAGHHVKLELTTQIVTLETNARVAPHAPKSFTTTTAAAAKTGGLCRLKHTFKHTGFPKDGY